MPRRGKYPDELRDRAVRMVLDHQHEYGSQWEAMCSVAEKLGPKPETVGASRGVVGFEVTGRVHHVVGPSA